MDYPVEAELEVRFRDCDPMGHVNNAVYATYLEVGRQAYWRRFTDPRDYRQVPFVVVRIEIDFRSPAIVGEALRVALRASWIGRRSFGLEYRITERKSGRLVAEARSVQAAFDYARSAVIPVPEDLRRQLETVEGRPVPEKPVGPEGAS